MFRKTFQLACAAILISTLASLAAPVKASVPAQSPVTADSIAGIIEQYRTEIPTRMEQQGVPGLAIAVVDDQNILWAEGFGYTDWDRTTPVTANTLFSIQSMSKSFTATAAMFAAQDGLVELDAPITTYLPDFHVNSVFEEQPEQKMTLRLLLSHTAGLVHEAPVGGNNDLPGRTFEEHIASISETWLMFPVGTRYSYSNLGIDLVGYILQVRSGMPFTQYVKEKVLGPLGMASSTLDVRQVRATPGRAVGHGPLPFRPPAEWLIIPSGGVWSTANDMARYLQFHINGGALDGTRLLRQDLAETMYTPPSPVALKAEYALGIGTADMQGTRRFQHGGGGFGFNSNMVWYPELKLGAVVLTDAEHDDLYWKLTNEVLGSIINSNIPLYHARASNLPAVQPAYPFISNGPAALSDSDLRSLIASKALPLDEAARQRRQALAGEYVFTRWGFPIVAVQLQENNGALTQTALGETVPLTEVQPGVYFDPQGSAADSNLLAAKTPNSPLHKINLQIVPLQVAFYVVCGLLFLSALLFWPLRALVRRIRGKKSLLSAAPAEPAPGRQPRLPWNALAAILAGLASLFSLLCLAVVAIVPNMIYVPWPRPWIDLLWWQYAALSLPFASIVLAAAAALALDLPTHFAKSQAWGRPLRIYYALVALALVGFNLAIIL